MRGLVSSAFDEALGILGKYFGQLDQEAQRLREKATLTHAAWPVLEEFRMAAASGLSV